MQQNHEKPDRADEPPAQAPSGPPGIAPVIAPGVAPETAPGMVPARFTLAQWWAQGWRSAFLLAPRWPAMPPSAGQLVLLLALPLLLSLLAERLTYPGAAEFYWPSLLTQGWMDMAAAAFACWWAMQRGAGVRGRPPVSGWSEPAPDAVSLFALLCAQTLPLTVLTSLLVVPMARGADAASGAPLPWPVAWLAVCWAVFAQLRLLWRCGIAQRGQRALAMAVLALAAFTTQEYAASGHWYPAPDLSAEAGERDRFQLTQQLVEQQSQLMQQQLQAVRRHQPGRAELYTIAYAPNAEEPVFRREAAMVTEVMQQRFDTREHSVQLVNHHTDSPQAGWATPLNLQRAIERMAALMDREQDVLFIHLTSHGARGGELAHAFEPLHVEGLRPQQLKAWLDAAGIRHRIISVSACFSGSWIAPLAGDDTLVMTAADSEHTSYGCGRKSELTFFGRAMYDEAMRNGADFETAFAQARVVIERREREAGKSDGYSNPQIAMGAGLREHLQQLQPGPGMPAPAGRRVATEHAVEPAAEPAAESANKSANKPGNESPNESAHGSSAGSSAGSPATKAPG